MAAALGGNACLFDFDGDADLDLFWISPTEQHLYKNDSGKFTDVISHSGVLAAKSTNIGVGAVAGDYDNDGKPDLFVIRDGSLALYHNEGGTFLDVTRAAGLPAYPYLPSAVAFVDVDHDGDLDLFIAGLADLSKATEGGTVFPDDFPGAPNMLLRNDGNGKFSDMTAAAKLGSIGHSTAIVPTDFNNRRDIDLFVLSYGKAPQLFSNLRDGSFRNVAGETGLNGEGHWSTVAAGDVNKDGYTDFYLGRTDGPGLFALSDGHEKFKTTIAPDQSQPARGAQFLDYDNDGLLDLLVLTDKGLRLWRNVGDSWMDVSERAVAPQLNSKLSPGGRLLAAGDVDNDGDTDLIVPCSSGRLCVARNDGGSSNHSLRIMLSGKVSNRSAVGAKVEVRAGSLAQKLESYSASPAPAPADVIFGLGPRTRADALRVLWPAGIVQAETQIAGGTASKNSQLVSLTELDRKPSSCPYLYVWNGEQFEFLTDFMGGGEMGHLERPGSYNSPDPDEYVRIAGDQVKARNGRYELRVTNELEEAVFLDHLQLIAVAHPQEVEIYPNEGLGAKPTPFRLYTTRAKAPLAAVDDHGHNVLLHISVVDRQYPDDFRLHQIRGYADEHSLTLELGENRKDSNMLLLLTGWTDYAWSSDMLAASQGGMTLMPPAIQVKDASGRWQTVIENIGIPVGRPQTVTVDLTGKFLSSSREVRIVTNMRIYWDQILVDAAAARDYPVQMTRLNPLQANLRWRGYSEELSPDGRQPLSYNYNKVSFTSPWKVMTGRYTREGDVRQLLLKSDDIFVVSRPGDEISLSFAAAQLPPLPYGWKRTFLLYADGFSKEMDINSASPDEVGPLPFHGMSKYPYEWPERYPLTEERLRYLETYNTRVVSSPVTSLLAELLMRQ
jgi:hypothetical protein